MASFWHNLLFLLYSGLSKELTMSNLLRGGILKMIFGKDQTLRRLREVLESLEAIDSADCQSVNHKTLKRIDCLRDHISKIRQEILEVDLLVDDASFLANRCTIISRIYPNEFLC